MEPTGDSPNLFDADDPLFDEDRYLWLAEDPYSVEETDLFFYSLFSHSQEIDFRRARCHACLDLRLDLLKHLEQRVRNREEGAGRSYQLNILYKHLLTAATDRGCFVCAMFKRALERFCRGVEFFESLEVRVQ